LRTRETRVVVLDAETSPFIDVTAAQMLAQLAAALRQDGIELRIARDIGQFRDVMHTAVPGDFRRSVFRTVDEALSDGTPRDGNTTQYG
jgi:sulfate permease, SulP family